MMKILIEVVEGFEGSRGIVKEIKKKVKKLLMEEKTKGELSITFCDDRMIHALNKKYRKKDKPTDVLSFEFGDKHKIIGDIYISVPTAIRQAKEHNVSLLEELARLAMHGTLHVLGYNHKEMLARLGGGIYGA